MSLSKPLHDEPAAASKEEPERAASYQKSGLAPEEQASDSKVSRRVAFEDNVDVDMVALTSGAARLVKGFITREQHSTLRSLLNLEPGENCFGKDGHCPLCAKC